jgi:environmental stress-induced protein Ves
MQLIPPKQTSNFVVFPGMENILSILERNGVPVQPPQ